MHAGLTATPRRMTFLCIGKVAEVEIIECLSRQKTFVCIGKVAGIKVVECLSRQKAYSERGLSHRYTVPRRGKLYGF